MLNNIQDVYVLVKAISVFSVCALLCWSIFYLGMILRSVYLSFRDIQQMIKKADDILTTIRDKVEHSLSYLLLINEGVKKLVDYFKDKQPDQK